MANNARRAPKAPGRDFVVLVGDIETATNFKLVGAMRSTSFSINNETVDVTAKGADAWRELLEGAGVQSVSMSAAGPMTNAETIKTMRAEVMRQGIRYYKIVSKLGYYFIGKFQATSLEIAGEHNAEETYSLSLESSETVQLIDE